jgi:hypothetical protein
MAYGFLERQKDEEVKMYLEEEMYFEAWITVMRNTNLTAEQFSYKLEQECYCKSSKLSEDEKDSLYCEWCDLTSGGEWTSS